MTKRIEASWSEQEGWTGRVEGLVTARDWNLAMRALKIARRSNRLEQAQRYNEDLVRARESKDKAESVAKDNQLTVKGTKK